MAFHPHIEGPIAQKHKESSQLKIKSFMPAPEKIQQRGMNI